MAITKSAWVLRVLPGRIDRLKECLETNVIVMGWADGGDLTGLDSHQLRDCLHEVFYKDDTNKRRAGAAAGNILRFTRDMEVGDYVLVPVPYGFHVAEITGEARFHEEHVETDTALRRDVKWLTDPSKPIKRDQASSRLNSRLKIRGTSASASDLAEEIRRLLKEEKEPDTRTFETDLREKLGAETLAMLRNGRMKPRKFEELIADTLKRQGAVDVSIRAGRGDKGVDVVAEFMLAGLLPVKVGVQAKHWDDRAPLGPEVVDQLQRGMEEEGLAAGMIITTGVISEEAEERAKALAEEDLQIEMIDGELLAGLIVEMGIEK